MDELPVSQISKFDGKNFQVWKFLITNVLVANNLLDVVQGRRAKTTNEEKAKFVIDDARAKVILSTTMTQKQVLEILSYETSQEIWKSRTKI